MGAETFAASMFLLNVLFTSSPLHFLLSYVILWVGFLILPNNTDRSIYGERQQDPKSVQKAIQAQPGKKEL